MKRISLFFITALSTSLQLLGSPVFVQQTREVLRARAYGAKTKVIFKVIDDMGRPVKNAAVGAGFYMNKAPGKNPSCKGLTDIDGIFVAHEESAGEVNYSIRKDGYYTTRGRIWLAGTSTQKAEIKDGKWQPYGEIHTVVIKPIKKTENMIFYIPEPFENMLVPITNTWVGLDMKKRDWLRPYGSGDVIDIEMSLSFVGQLKIDYRMVTLKIRTVRPFDGMYRAKKDLYSEYVSVYHTDTNKTFTEQISFKCELDKITKKWNYSQLDNEEYLVLRTRSEVDELGNFKGAHYSKIYGEFLFGQTRDSRGFVNFQYFYNPKFNDTNLESEWEYRQTEEYFRLRDQKIRSKTSWSRK